MAPGGDLARVAARGGRVARVARMCVWIFYFYFLSLFLFFACGVVSIFEC